MMAGLLSPDFPGVDPTVAAAYAFSQAAAQQVTLANLVAHQQRLNAVHAASLMAMPAPFSVEAQALADTMHARILTGQAFPFMSMFGAPLAHPSPAQQIYQHPYAPHVQQQTQPTTSRTADEKGSQSTEVPYYSAPTTSSNNLYPSLNELTVPLYPPTRRASNVSAQSGTANGSYASPVSSPPHDRLDVASPPSSLQSPLSSNHSSPLERDSELHQPSIAIHPVSQYLVERGDSKKRALESEMADMVQDVKRGKLSLADVADGESRTFLPAISKSLNSLMIF